MMLARAVAALQGPSFDVRADEPFAASIALARQGLGGDARIHALLSSWQAFHPGSATGEMRYRFAVGHRRVPPPTYAGTPDGWVPWRSVERGDAMAPQDPLTLEERLCLPLVLADAAELLCSCAAGGHPVAKELLQEAGPRMRRDFAQFVRVVFPEADTLALFALARRPRAFGMLQPFALGIAACYAALARDTDGVVLGARFPTFQRPVASASAQLASGLWSLGVDTDLLPPLLGFVAGQQHPEGGFGDAGGAPDLMTTLACAEVLASVDPAFDPERTTAFFQRSQRSDGTFCAMGPETPWLTAGIVQWLQSTARPFSERFRWPMLLGSSRDQKTGLPSFSYFSELADLFSQVGALATSRVGLAFIDLAGFRDFNNRFGQQVGDEALAHFAAGLRELPGVSAVRDGGDEFLVVGAPTGSGLLATLDGLRQAWPARFFSRFGEGVPPVAPRILVTEGAGRHLRAMRELLGRSLAPLKGRTKTPDATGVLESIPFASPGQGIA